MNPAPDDHPFWRFSLALYGAPGVAEECIRLQDRHGVDINVLLFVAWLGAEREFLLSPEALQAIQAAASDWQQNVVSLVRTARRHIDRSHHPALYEEIKSLELKLEQVEQSRLFALASTLDGPKAAPPDALNANIALYAQATGAPMPTALLAAATARIQRSS